jgi:hypothetical protein
VAHAAPLPALTDRQVVLLSQLSDTHCLPLAPPDAPSIDAVGLLPPHPRTGKSAAIVIPVLAAITIKFL